MKLTLILSLIVGGLAFAAPDKATFNELVCVNNQAPVDGNNNKITLDQENGTYTLTWSEILGGRRSGPVTQPAPVIVEGLSCDSSPIEAREVDCHNGSDSFSLTHFSSRNRFEGDQFVAKLNGKKIATFDYEGDFNAITPNYCKTK